jgi:TctA family transporter
MLLSGGDPMVFLHRPISATLLAVAVILLAILIFPAIRRKREEALKE